VYPVHPARLQASLVLWDRHCESQIAPHLGSTGANHAPTSFAAVCCSRNDAAAEYQHILKAETTGDREVTFMFDGAGRHRVSVGRLPILPKAWWEGSDNAGRKRDIGSTTLEPPLGSGPYASRSSRLGVASSMSA
jgi:hypothetical protein